MKSFLTSTVLFSLAALSIVTASPLNTRAVTCAIGTKSDGNGGCVCTATYGTTANNACSCNSSGGWPVWNEKVGQCSPQCPKFSKLNPNGVQCDCTGTGNTWRGPSSGCMCDNPGMTPDSKGNCVSKCKAGTSWKSSGAGTESGSCVCNATYGTTVDGACACPNSGWPVWNASAKQCSPKCPKFSKLNANGVQCDCTGKGAHWRGPNSGCRCDDDNAEPGANGDCACKAGFKLGTNGFCSK